MRKWQVEIVEDPATNDAPSTWTANELFVDYENGNSVDELTGIVTETPGATIYNYSNVRGDSFTTPAAPSAPVWGVLQDQSTAENKLPQTYNIEAAISNDGPITYSLVSPPAGFVLAGTIVTAEAGLTVSDNVITVRAANNTGATDKVFNWAITPTMYTYSNILYGEFTPPA